MGLRLSRKVPLKSLCSTLRAELANIDYAADDVTVAMARSVSTHGIANDGERAVCVTIDDIEPDPGCGVGAIVEYGTFGGPSPFTRQPIDTERSRDLSPRGAIIFGSTSNTRKSPRVTVYLRPYMFATVASKALEVTFIDADKDFLSVCADAATESRWEVADRIAEEALARASEAIPDVLTADERKIMYAYGAIKSGPYRRDEIARAFESMSPKSREIYVSTLVDNLVIKGFLRRASNGAISMTVAGKNTRSERGNAGYDSW